MAFCHLSCSPDILKALGSHSSFEKSEWEKVEFPVTGSSTDIEILVVGPSIEKVIELAATVSDWNVPPVTLFILPEDLYLKKVEQILYHPRVGRSIFIAPNSPDGLNRGLQKVFNFLEKAKQTWSRNSIGLKYRWPKYFPTVVISIADGENG